MKACRNVCGPTRLPIPARRATRRTIRPAACRSSRSPLASRKIGPSSRSPTAKSTARATRAGEWHRHQLAALAQHGQRAMAVFQTERLDVGTDRLRHAEPVQRQQRHQRMIPRRRKPGGDEDRTQLVTVQVGDVGLVIKLLGRRDVHRRRVLDHTLSFGVAIEAPNDRAQPMPPPSPAPRRGP